MFAFEQHVMKNVIAKGNVETLQYTGGRKESIKYSVYKTETKTAKIQLQFYRI